jgi:DNA-directed RNA polymerase sigma subunit (sigma70/sigma32)
VSFEGSLVIVLSSKSQVTRRTAIDVVRREASRQLREQIATEMDALNATAADWTHIEPLLDEAMHALDDTDRAAVLLRYFENKSLREVGVTLGTSENAAQKRVSRAIERLREFFAKRGITVGASGLVVVISSNAVQAAPVGLAVTISTVATVAGTTNQAPKLTAGQVESYLKENQRSAASLLAAYRTTDDQTLLDEAMRKFPNDPQVAFEAAFKKDASPEEQRQWLHALKQSAPLNALADYLSAAHYFKAGQPDQAVQDLIAASGKPQFQDYTLERVQDDDSLNRMRG